MTNNEFIRSRLLKDVHDRVPDLSSLRHTEWNDDFERLMRNRLVMGRFRYGVSLKSEDTRPSYFFTKWIKDRIDKWQETGNDEFLVDVANECMVAFSSKAHEKSHFQGTDRP